MIFEKVKGILAEQLDIDEDSITADSSIVEDLGADSLDIVDLVMSLKMSSTPRSRTRRSRASRRSETLSIILKRTQTKLPAAKMGKAQCGAPIGSLRSLGRAAFSFPDGDQSR